MKTPLPFAIALFGAVLALALAGCEDVKSRLKATEDPPAGAAVAAAGDRAARPVAAQEAVPAAAPGAQGQRGGEAGVPLLRYGWQDGAKYLYRVRIEVDEGDAVEILTGTPMYTVRSKSTDQTELAFSGGLHPSRQAKGRIPFAGPPDFSRLSPFSPFTGVGGARFGEHTLSLDDRGQVKSMQEDSQLPYMLGNLSLLVIHPFPAEAQHEWSVREETSISITDDRFPRPRFGPRGFARDDGTTTIDATEETKFRIERVEADSVVIDKQYALRTSQTVGGKPRFEMTGRGDLRFDRRRGVPVKMDYRVSVNSNDTYSSHTTPITISAEILSEQEIAQREQEAAERTPRPLEGEERNAVLADLESPELEKLRQAARRLEYSVAGENREEVARAAAELLTHSDQQVRQSAAKALSIWGTAESVPALLAALEDQAVPVRWAVMEALGKLKDPRAAEPLARRLEVGIDRLSASGALQQLGPAAEEAVLPYVTHAEWPVRQTVYGILEQVATEKSVAPLEKAVLEESVEAIRPSAHKALDAAKRPK